VVQKTCQVPFSYLLRVAYPGGEVFPKGARRKNLAERFLDDF